VEKFAILTRVNFIEHMWHSLSQKFTQNVRRSQIQQPVFQISLRRRAKIGSGALPVSYKMSTGGSGFLPGGQSGQDLKLTTHLHPAQRLRTRGALASVPHTSSPHGA